MSVQNPFSRWQLLEAVKEADRLDSIIVSFVEISIMNMCYYVQIGYVKQLEYSQNKQVFECQCLI